MIIFDGKKKVNITIQKWNGANLESDWSQDYFDACNLKYDEDNECYIVNDVDYCVDMATTETNPEGARFINDENGNPVLDDNMIVNIDWL